MFSPLELITPLQIRKLGHASFARLVNHFTELPQKSWPVLKRAIEFTVVITSFGNFASNLVAEFSLELSAIPS